MAQKSKRRLTNETPYKETEGKNRRFLAWLFAITAHLLVIILMAALKVDNEEEKKEKKKQEIAFGMEVVRGRDNAGSNATKVPIEAVNPSVTTPSESSKNVVTSEKSPVSTTSKGKTKKKEKPKTTKKREKAPDKTNTTNTGGNKGDSKTGQKGDDKDKSGNKGSQNGTVNKNALYNGSGGTGNDNLKLSGWKWSKYPAVNDQSSARGKIVFKIVVNDDGKIEQISRISATVGASVVAKYAAQIKKTARFQLLNPDIEPKTYTTGTLTIVIKNQ